jgi:hypothetical protein
LPDARSLGDISVLINPTFAFARQRYWSEIQALWQLPVLKKMLKSLSLAKELMALFKTLH